MSATSLLVLVLCGISTSDMVKSVYKNALCVWKLGTSIKGNSFLLQNPCIFIAVTLTIFHLQVQTVFPLGFRGNTLPKSPLTHIEHQLINGPFVWLKCCSICCHTGEKVWWHFSHPRPWEVMSYPSSLWAPAKARMTVSEENKSQRKRIDGLFLYIIDLIVWSIETYSFA